MLSDKPFPYICSGHVLILRDGGPGRVECGVGLSERKGSDYPNVKEERLREGCKTTWGAILLLPPVFELAAFRKIDRVP